MSINGNYRRLRDTDASKEHASQALSTFSSISISSAHLSSSPYPARNNYIMVRNLVAHMMQLIIT